MSLIKQYATSLSAFKSSLGTFLDEVPDMPPTGQSGVYNNSFLDWARQKFVVGVRCAQSMGLPQRHELKDIVIQSNEEVTPNLSDNSTNLGSGGPCLIGHFCEKNTIDPEPCKENYYQSLPGKSSCER